jgi:hypothetical protein
MTSKILKAFEPGILQDGLWKNQAAKTQASESD